MHTRYDEFKNEFVSLVRQPNEIRHKPPTPSFWVRRKQKANITLPIIIAEFPTTI
jgi:hypothetical protein